MEIRFREQQEIGSKDMSEGRDLLFSTIPTFNFVLERVVRKTIFQKKNIMGNQCK